MTRRRSRIPGTRRAEFLPPLEGEAKLLGLVWPWPLVMDTTDGGIIDTLATDVQRVAQFFDRHGVAPDDTRAVVSRWSWLGCSDGVIAVLTIDGSDFDAPELELAFPLPEAMRYIGDVAAAGSVALCSLQPGHVRVMRVEIATDIAVVRAGYLLSLLVAQERS